MRKICVVTGTRAEYGLLRWVMEGIKDSSKLELQVCVTGMHLSPEFGLTYREIEADGFSIDYKVEMLLSSDSPVGVSKSMGLGMIGIAEAFDRLQPDMIILLGDRYEALAAGAAAMIARVPIAHLHGGEATEGLIDEPIRHSLTKMSHLHFVAAEEYRRRVVQLGEDPARVFCVGGLGIENILKLKLMERGELESSLEFKLERKNLLITFHPVTLEKQTSSDQMKELLTALDELEETNFIFTMPNADTDGRSLFEVIESYVGSRSHARVFTSLGQVRYLSCMKYVDAVVGNSSSGLIEAPSFHKPTINIGDRQRGRLKAESIIDCKPDRVGIRDALSLALDSSFQQKLVDVENPYGNGAASGKIVEVLATAELKDILKKAFYDLPVE